MACVESNSSIVPGNSNRHHITADLLRDLREEPQRFRVKWSNASTPDPGTEDMYNVKDNMLAFSPGQLSKLVKFKNHNASYALGGLTGLGKGLSSASDTLIPLYRSRSKRQPEVAVVIKGYAVAALPDTGTQLNIISPSLVKKIGLVVKIGTNRIIHRSGREEFSPGTVRVPFQFSGEPHTYEVDCAVLPDSIHDFILGNAVLRHTETLTRFSHRIKISPSTKESSMRQYTSSKSSLSKRKQHANPSATLRQYKVPGVINGYRVTALPDTGAEHSCISPSLVKKIGLVVERGTEQYIQLPSRKLVLSPGIVRVPFQFSGEPEPHMVDCAVVPNCIHDLILGGHILRVTKTLTEFFHRVITSTRKITNRLGLKLLGNGKQRVRGSLNGMFAAALPDTGSDVMLVSAAYANLRGFQVDEGFDSKVELELADGSTVFTSGIVRDGQWGFGDTGETISCDFYVLDKLDVDVILSNTFLFDFEVFKKYEHCFFDLDSTADLSELYNIRLIGQYSNQLLQLEDLFVNDMNSPDAFSEARVTAELIRRDRIRDAILDLGSSLQGDAWRGENERKRQWEELRKRHLAKHQQCAPSRNPSLTSDETTPAKPPGSQTRRQIRLRFSSLRKLGAEPASGIALHSLPSR